MTSGKWNLRVQFHNSWRLHTCRSTPGMIYSIVNYNVFCGNFLSYKNLLLSGKIYMVEQQTVKYLAFFTRKLLKQHTLKIVLQEPLFCKKEASLTKTIVLDISFFLESFLDFKFSLLDINLGSSNCGCFLGTYNSLWKMPFEMCRLFAL